ncbi:MAG: hypothetical protein O3B86_12695, partial [Planctomycetota bacterium]|nr:hypothetical protein [Planctomycetota bacterium]
ALTPLQKSRPDGVMSGSGDFRQTARDIDARMATIIFGILDNPGIFRIPVMTAATICEACFVLIALVHTAIVVEHYSAQSGAD